MRNIFRELISHWQKKMPLKYCFTHTHTHHILANCHSLCISIAYLMIPLVREVLILIKISFLWNKFQDTEYLDEVLWDLKRCWESLTAFPEAMSTLGSMRVQSLQRRWTMINMVNYFLSSGYQMWTNCWFNFRFLDY